VKEILQGASPNATDVDILIPDITAGRGVVHLTTNYALHALFPQLGVKFTLRVFAAAALQPHQTRDGTATWFLPGASPNATDVDILTPDITAGRGVVHLTTNFVVDAPLRSQHQQIRAGSGDNCSRYSNTSGVDTGLDVPGFDADVAARGGGALAAAAAAPVAVKSAGGTCGWGGVGLAWRLVVVAVSVVAVSAFGVTP
jgi:hypothetical protein